MDLDWFIFPSPDSSYTYDKVKTGELLYIPKKKIDEYETDEPVNNIYKSIPCLFIKSNSPNTPNNKIYAIFFHGNAEDINLANEMLTHIRSTLSVNVIAPEFAGYGIYSGYPTEGQLFNDALNVFDYMKDEMKIDPNNIIIFGRSLGTSIATHLASKRRCAALILISPFLSIRHMIKDILGRFISFAIKDRFRSGEYIKNVESPILIIHGQIDSIIKYYHATELYNRTTSPCELILPENMEHNEFDFYHEFSEPLQDFIARNGIFSEASDCKMVIKDEIRTTPEEFKNPPKNWNCITAILKKFSFD
jgi:pimeloyl-ACP methyl ester carboxylesterase